MDLEILCGLVCVRVWVCVCGFAWYELMMMIIMRIMHVGMTENRACEDIIITLLGRLKGIKC